MLKVSHFALIAFFTACIALLMALMFAPDDDNGRSCGTEQQESEEETWS